MIANKRTKGRLDGSIIEAIIACQATTNRASATPNGSPPSISASWCRPAAPPLTSAMIATIQAPAMATRTAGGTRPIRAAPTAASPRPG